MRRARIRNAGVTGSSSVSGNTLKNYLLSIFQMCQGLEFSGVSSGACAWPRILLAALRNSVFDDRAESADESALATSGLPGVYTGIQRGTPPRASQLIDWAQQGETGTVQIAVARNPPLEHAFGLLLKHLAHHNRASHVERRSTLAPCGHPLRPMSNRLPLRRRSRGHRHLLAMTNES